VKHFCLCLLLMGLAGCAAKPIAVAKDDGRAPHHFGGAPGALASAKARLAAGDASLQPALAQLIERANRALKANPPSVT